MTTFKYFLTKDNKYLLMDTLETGATFIEINKYRPPTLFPVDTKIENIYSKILGNDEKISDIYEKYLEI